MSRRNPIYPEKLSVHPQKVLLQRNKQPNHYQSSRFTINSWPGYNKCQELHSVPYPSYDLMYFFNIRCINPTEARIAEGSANT